MKPATNLGIALFVLVALMHGLRLIFQTEVMIGGTNLPMWTSVLGFVVPAFLAVAIRREAAPHRS